MKKSIFLPVIALALSIVLPSPDTAAQKSQSADVLLGAALHQEEVEGNLEAAIETYKKLLAEFPGNRPLAAQAQFRIGMCYEKLGRREAQKAYKEVLAKYTDQTEFAAKARERLAALQSGSAAAATASQDTNLIIRRVPKLDMNAKPSPDGKYLAYRDGDTGNLAIQDVATGTTRLLTKDGSWEEITQYPENLIWSPDSRRIAYTWEISGPKVEYCSELRVLSLDGDSPPKTIIRDKGGYVWPFDWAPGGSRILCGLSTGGWNYQLALVSVDNGTVEKMDYVFSGSFWSRYRFTADGDSILYSHPADGKGGAHDIYLRDIKSGETKTIVEHPAEDLVVGLLPGTDWLLFASNRRGSLDLWGVPFNDGKADGQPFLIKQGMPRFIPLSFTNVGLFYYATLTVTDDVFLADFDPETQRILGEPRLLSSRWEGITMDAHFSPDGKSLAYVTKRSPNPLPVHSTDSLVVQSLEDVNAYPVVVDFSDFHLRNVNDPCWAADGKSLVVAGRRVGEKGLVRGLIHVDLPSLRKTDIYWAPPDHRVGFPECARRTDFIYFIFGGEQPPRYSVIRIGMDGRGENEVFRAPEGQRIRSIALSPDEKTLSIIVSPSLQSPSNCALLLLPLDGGPVRRIHEFMQYTGGSVGHAWTPDGNSIFYTVKDKKEEWSWSIQRISVNGGGASETVYRRNAPSFGLAFHPNGHMFAFTGRVGSSDTSEVWVMENLRDELKKLAAEKELH